MSVDLSLAAVRMANAFKRTCRIATSSSLQKLGSTNPFGDPSSLASVKLINSASPCKLAAHFRKLSWRNS